MITRSVARSISFRCRLYSQIEKRHLLTFVSDCTYYLGMERRHTELEEPHHGGATGPTPSGSEPAYRSASSPNEARRKPHGRSDIEACDLESAGMSAEQNTDGSIKNTGLNVTEGAFAVGGLTCAVGFCSHSGTVESEMLSPRHLFACRGSRSHGAVEWFLDGKRYAASRKYGETSLLLPGEQRWIAKHTGSVRWRYIACELEHSAFARVLGDQIGAFDLRPHFGPSPIAPGLLERLESLCLNPNDFPLVYAESLASLLVVELFRASATKPIPLELTSGVGSSRFKVVIDFIEQYLDRDVGLNELASLIGLSVTRFSHAFKTSYGVSPHRYISQRRIKRAQTLLRTTDDTVATIAARVGFSSQSRFSRVFTSLIGSAPSTCRSTSLRNGPARSFA
jgi:AraC-like DNA-binding protein